MSELFGVTRDTINQRYALRTPAGFVPSHLPGWSGVEVIVQISPAMGSRFGQYLITMDVTGEGRASSGETEFFILVLQGQCAVDMDAATHVLTAGSFVFIPPNSAFRVHGAECDTQLLIFQKRFEPLDGTRLPEARVGHLSTVPGKAFLGNDDAQLQVLLPDEPAYDMAVNIFTYQPGATLPFVESHIMEHGLLMLRGQGVYRLGADYHPVMAGDVIWMAPFCPQWFVAMGKTPTSYIYYKDVNRAPVL